MSQTYGWWHQYLKSVTNVNPWNKDTNQLPTWFLQYLLAIRGWSMLVMCSRLVITFECWRSEVTDWFIINIQKLSWTSTCHRHLYSSRKVNHTHEMFSNSGHWIPSTWFQLEVFGKQAARETKVILVSCPLEKFTTILKEVLCQSYYLISVPSESIPTFIAPKGMNF